MTKYVLGFMFNEKCTDVLLIEKLKPDWQKGKFNGIGGKMGEGELGSSAMAREFEEETGIEYDDWNYVVTMYGDDWLVEVFTAKSDDVFSAASMEEEKVNLIPISELHKYDVIPNLDWLIPMCLDERLPNLKR